MAISFVNRTVTGYPAATTTIVGTVPASVANDDFLIWVVAAATATAPTTPAGWTLSPAQTGTSSGLWAYVRKAASEPASYNMTVTSSRYSTTMLAYRGVDTTTAQDTAFTTRAAGTTIIQPPAITTVTANAWVVCLEYGSEAAGGVSTVWSSSNTTLRSTISSTGATGTTASIGVGDVLQVSPGAFTGAFTAATTGTFVRSLAMSMALRPAAATGATVTGVLASSTFSAPAGVAAAPGVPLPLRPLMVRQAVNRAAFI